MACTRLPPPAPPSPAPPKPPVPPPPAPPGPPPADPGFSGIVLDLANSYVMGGVGDGGAITLAALMSNGGQSINGNTVMVHVVLQNTSNSQSAKGNVRLSSSDTGAAVFPDGVQQVTIGKGSYTVIPFQIVKVGEYGSYQMTLDIGDGNPLTFYIGFNVPEGGFGA